MTARNDNIDDEWTPPILVLTRTGDGRALYRTLARVLVRQELIFASSIPEQSNCETVRAAG